ncbi:hypothetical protein F4678DRAFT_425251 [Xylaria arbuscula]|nr:hypothetical protein F4678DRAFT_425251 [Xylaria arbuscula]
MEEIERTPSIVGNASGPVSQFSGCLCVNGENLLIVTRKLNRIVERSIMPTRLVVLENPDHCLTPRFSGSGVIGGIDSPLNAEREAGGPRSQSFAHIRTWADDPKSSTFPRISKPIELMRNWYDCVVIGSGYGSGVAVARMAARAGEPVSLLENGKESGPGEFPSDTGNEKVVLSKTPFDMDDLTFGNEGGASVGNGLWGKRSMNANVIFADTVAMVTSSLCAWAIRQYDKSLDHQSRSYKLDPFTVTPSERQLLEQSMPQLAKLFEKPLLPVLTFALLYTAGVSTVYYLHRNDRYLNPALGLGSCAAIVAGLVQGIGMRGAIVQLVPGAVALTLLLSAVFHYLYVAELKQRRCNIQAELKLESDGAEWMKWVYHGKEHTKLGWQRLDYVLINEKNVV